MKVRFQTRHYSLVLTDHAREQMELRGISQEEVVYVIENGKVKPKESKGRYWVFLSLKARNDNLICASISLESPNLIVITTLVNWSPK